MTPAEVEVALYAASEHLHLQTATESLLYAIQQAQAYSPNETPDIVDVASVWTDLHDLQCGCITHAVMHRDRTQVVVEWCLRNLHIAPDCGVVQLLVDYNLVEGALPLSVDHFTAFTRMDGELRQDPDAFSQEHRVQVPTVHREHLPTTVTDGSSMCGLCQEALPPQETVYEMPCCKGVFHYDESACLGDGNGIQKWLARSSVCPLCAQEVTIARRGGVKGSTRV